MVYDTQWYPLTVPSSWKGHRNWEDHPTLSGHTGFAWYRGVRFEVRALPVVATGDAAARVTAEDGRIRAEGADTVTLLVAVGTDARSSIHEPGQVE